MGHKQDHQVASTDHKSLSSTKWKRSPTRVFMQLVEFRSGSDGPRNRFHSSPKVSGTCQKLGEGDRSLAASTGLESQAWSWRPSPPFCRCKRICGEVRDQWLPRLDPEETIALKYNQTLKAYQNPPSLICLCWKNSETSPISCSLRACEDPLEPGSNPSYVCSLSSQPRWSDLATHHTLLHHFVAVWI